MTLISMNNVSFTYPNGHQAVQQLDFELQAGENIAIIGQNGAGKTTTVKMMNGLLEPTEGTVLVNEKNTKKYTTAQISKEVGYVFQNPDDQIFNNRVYDEIAYSIRQLGFANSEVDERVKKYARLCGVQDYLDDNPYDLPLSIRKLVTVASVIVSPVKLVILDEPTAGQDKKGMEVISSLIKSLLAENRAVITITHDMEFVKDNFSQVVVMANSRLQKRGSTEEIFFDQKMMDIASLKPPMIVQVIQYLGLNVTSFDLADLASQLKSL